MTRAPGGDAELHGRQSDPARGGVHEQPLARLQRRATVQPEPRRLVRDREAGGLGVVDSAGGARQTSDAGSTRTPRARRSSIRRRGRPPSTPRDARRRPRRRLAASSIPGLNGSSGFTWYSPAGTAARRGSSPRRRATLTSTSPAAGRRAPGRRRADRASAGSPSRVTRHARIASGRAPQRRTSGSRQDAASVLLRLVRNRSVSCSATSVLSSGPSGEYQCDR